MWIAQSPLFAGYSHYFLHRARFALPPLSGSVVEVELAALPSGSERDCWGCWRRDVECQLGPGLWTLDSELQPSGPDGVVLHPQHFAHLVYQLELGIGNHEFPTFGWPAPGGHYFLTITFFACRPCSMGLVLRDEWDSAKQFRVSRPIPI